MDCSASSGRNASACARASFSAGGSTSGFGQSIGNQRRLPERIVRVEHHLFQIVFGRGQRALRDRKGLFEGRHLGLCRNHFDGCEQALLRLPAVAFILLLGKPHAFLLHVKVLPGIGKFPIKLDRLGHSFNDALPQLF